MATVGSGDGEISSIRGYIYCYVADLSNTAERETIYSHEGVATHCQFHVTHIVGASAYDVTMVQFEQVFVIQCFFALSVSHMRWMALSYTIEGSRPQGRELEI